MSAAKAPSLSELQRWMMDVVTHPDGARSGIEAASKSGTSGLKGQKAHSIVRRSKNLTSLERISIYQEMYYLRLIEILEGDFSAVRHAVGEDEFPELAKAYVVAYPSKHYDLCNLGAKFSIFLRAAKSLKRRAFVADLAKLERAIEEVFDEKQVKALTVDELLSVPQDQWINARLSTVPSLRLISSRYPINAYFEAVRAEEHPRIPAPKASWLAVYRKKNFQVWRMELDRPQFAMLSALSRGKTVGQAVEACLEVPEAQSLDLASAVKGWFNEWAGSGFFASVGTK
jgi:hypothetical protein